VLGATAGESESNVCVGPTDNGVEAARLVTVFNQVNKCFAYNQNHVVSLLPQV